MLGWEEKGKFKHSFVMETNWMHLGRMEILLYILKAFGKVFLMHVYGLDLRVLWFVKLSLEITLKVI